MINLELTYEEYDLMMCSIEDSINTLQENLVQLKNDNSLLSKVAYLDTKDALCKLNKIKDKMYEGVNK